MAKLVIPVQSNKDNRSRAGGRGAASLFRPAEGTPFGAVKPIQAVAAVAIALACLCAALLHFRDLGGDNELSPSRAQRQADHKRLALAGLTHGRGGVPTDHGSDAGR